MKINFARNTVPSDSAASQFLNGLRFIAAFTVVLFHSMIAFGYPAYGKYFGNNMVHFAIASWIHSWYQIGYQFVMVFFVLSGYFISASVLKMITEDRWSWKDYLIKRLTRLWVVLIPALLLTLFWASLQIYMFGPKTFYGIMNIPNFIANVLFLQFIHAPQFGANYPLWSLSYEFWYYILFPCVVLTFVSKRWFVKSIYGLIVVALGLFLGTHAMEYFLVWLLGSLIVMAKPLPKSKINSSVALIVTGFIAYKSLNLFYSAPPAPAKQFGPDFAVGLAFAILVYTVVSLFNHRHSMRFDYYDYFAGFSYTLYLVHYPIINFLNAWQGSAHWRLRYYPLIILGIVIYAWLISRFTENQTSKIRRWVQRVLGKKEAKSFKQQKLRS